MADKATTESTDTQTSSSLEEKTSENENLLDGVQTEKESPTSQKESKDPVENDWNSLTGSTQERIREILSERDNYKSKVTNQAQNDLSTVNQNTYTAPTTTQVTTPEIDQAVNTLKEHGIATKDDLYALLGQIQREKDHDRLSSKYDGSHELPKYDKSEVEDYMRRKSIWNPEAAFRDMYFDEFVDAGRVSQKRGINSEKPTAISSGKGEPLTLDTLRSQLRGPKGRDIYEKMVKNPAEFDKLLTQLAQE